MDGIAVEVGVQKKESTSVKIERKFFSVTRWFGLACATLAVLVAVGFSVAAVFDATRSANTDISPTTPRYAALKDGIEKQKKDAPVSQAQENAVTKQERQVAREQAKLEFEKKLQPLISKIFQSLSKYATSLDQAQPDQDMLHKYVLRQMNAISSDAAKKESLQWQYVDGLVQASADLGDDAQRLAKLPEADVARLDWPNFIDWYTNGFHENIRAERQRVLAETAAAAGSKMAAGGQLMAAAAAFGVFAAFTILLVLLRIERNTRTAG